MHPFMATPRLQDAIRVLHERAVTAALPGEGDEKGRDQLRAALRRIVSEEVDRSGGEIRGELRTKLAELERKLDWLVGAVSDPNGRPLQAGEERPLDGIRLAEEHERLLETTLQRLEELEGGRPRTGAVRFLMVVLVIALAFLGGLAFAEWQGRLGGPLPGLGWLSDRLHELGAAMQPGPSRTP